MPHYPKPSFRPARGLWYVQFAGKQVNLGPDRTAAFKAYHGLMERRDQPSESPPASVAAQARLVAVVIDEFLQWCQKNRAADISRWYKDRLNSFCLTIPADLTTDLLKPHHVQKWVDGYKVPLASGSRRNPIASVKRAMRWAEEQGYLERSPLAHMRKPGCGRKELVVTPAQYEALLARTPDQAFKDLGLSAETADRRWRGTIGCGAGGAGTRGFHGGSSDGIGRAADGDGAVGPGRLRGGRGHGRPGRQDSPVDRGADRRGGGGGGGVPGVLVRVGRPARLPRPRGGRPAAGRVADRAGRAAVAVRVRPLRAVLHAAAPGAGRWGARDRAVPRPAGRVRDARGRGVGGAVPGRAGEDGRAVVLRPPGAAAA